MTTPLVYAMDFVSSSSHLAPLPTIATSTRPPDAASFISAFDRPSYIDWWRTEYSLAPKGQLISPPTYAGHFDAVSSSLATASSIDTSSIGSYFSSATLPPHDDNTIFLIFLRLHQALTSGTAGTNSSLVPICALHNRTPGPDPIHYAVIPYQDNPACNIFTPGPSSLHLYYKSAFMSSHELVETITDPQTNGVAWLSMGKSLTELADACQSSAPVIVPYGGFAYPLAAVYSDLSSSCPSSVKASSPVLMSTLSNLVVNVSSSTGPLGGVAISLVDQNGIVVSTKTDASGSAILPLALRGEVVYFAGAPGTAGFIATPPAQVPLANQIMSPRSHYG